MPNICGHNRHIELWVAEELLDLNADDAIPRDGFQVAIWSYNISEPKQKKNRAE
jgi:hypothetical protein